MLNVVADIPSKEDKFRSKFSRVEVSSSAIQMKEKLGEGDYDDNINAIKVLELGLQLVTIISSKSSSY